MRRKDKLLHITKLNKRLNESKINEDFSNDMAPYQERFTNTNNDGMVRGNNVNSHINNVIHSNHITGDGRLNEHHNGEYSNTIMDMTINQFLDTLKSKDKLGYEVVEKVIEHNFKETVEEDDREDYYYPFDNPEREESNTDPYELKEKIVGLGDDLEYIEEKNCGCSLEESEPTDVANSKWFSDEDGERIMDIQVD